MVRLDGLIRTFKSTVTDIKAFLHRRRWKEALIFFCFVLLSFGFWLLQALQQEYETDLSIPVRYNNVPANIIFESKIPDKITVHVRDKGSALLNYTLGQKFRAITLNLESLPMDTDRFIISRNSLETDIQKQILASTTVYNFEPQRILLNYGLRKSKEVPVVFNGSVSTESGFLVSSDIIITPSQVTVYASQSVLDTIQKVKTTFVDIKDAKKSITKNTELEQINGANLGTERVSVIIPIEEYTEKTLQVPVEVVQVPAKYKLRTFPQSVEVLCNIPISKFKDLTNESLAIQVPFQDLEENVTGSFTIDLTKKPDWVKNYTLNPNTIEFILEANYMNR
ncbi:MAG TPA: YbbR-like domain-containing protein [Candidatus Parabacteroides intestinavium]|nr:YbbR-like domain-containing protein [Candidatus Parabacteroides intestinavium]